MSMRAGLRRLIGAWVAFGVLSATAVVMAVASRRPSPMHTLLAASAVGALTWALMEGFLGPWARDRQERRHARMDTREAADVMAGAVGVTLRAEDDKDGQRVRRCS